MQAPNQVVRTYRMTVVTADARFTTYCPASSRRAAQERIHQTFEDTALYIGPAHLVALRSRRVEVLA